MQTISTSEARTGTFCAIDFETASHRRDSACAMAIARVERNEIVDEWSTVIRPPGGFIHPTFTRIHGIRARDVRDAPEFAEVWSQARRLLCGARFLAAHNASFDASVLRASAERAEVPLPRIPFLCTVQVARSTWGIHPTKLPDVAAALGIALRHHDARSDAGACAKVVTAWRRHRADRTLQRGPERKHLARTK